MLNPAHRENDQKIEAAEVENAAPGSVVGELTGDIAAERTSIIWPRSSVHSSIRMELIMKKMLVSLTVARPGLGQSGGRATILALAAALTIVVVSVADKLSAPANHPQATAIISGRAEAKTARPVTKPIVPAKAIDPDAAVFIGTADGSAGYWATP